MVSLALVSGQCNAFFIGANWPILFTYIVAAVTTMSHPTGQHLVRRVTCFAGPAVGEEQNPSWDTGELFSSAWQVTVNHPFQTLRRKSFWSRLFSMDCNWRVSSKRSKWYESCVFCFVRRQLEFGSRPFLNSILANMIVYFLGWPGLAGRVPILSVCSCCRER